MNCCFRAMTKNLKLGAEPDTFRRFRCVIEYILNLMEVEYESSRCYDLECGFRVE